MRPLKKGQNSYSARWLDSQAQWTKPYGLKRQANCLCRHSPVIL
ncbi:MAG: hypothetical protein V9G20_10120 [Candidatus Promineifilaceae bacterium]